MIMCSTPNYIQKILLYYFENTKCRLLFTSFPFSQEHSCGEAAAVSAVTGMTVLHLHSHNFPREVSKPRHVYNVDTAI